VAVAVAVAVAVVEVHPVVVEVHPGAEAHPAVVVAGSDSVRIDFGTLSCFVSL
jgi:hypothetical protein